ncbi:hypothetical protein JCM8115_004628 [Rhodotorula mucilaginosa]
MGTKRWSAPRPAAHPHDENSAPPPPPWQSSSDSRSGHLGNSHANAKPRTHTRSQSWLSSLLKPSNSSKRRSKEPTPRPGRPLLADRQRSDDSVSALPQRRPSVVTRKPVPVITRVDSEEHPPRQATLNKELLRSSSMPIHLALKPLPVAVAEEENARWNWQAGGGVAEEPPRARTFTRLPSHSPVLERRALEPQPRSRSSAHASTSTLGRRTGPASPPIVPGKDRPLSDVAPSEVSDSRRTSGGSDASADIAFSGPILHNPPPLLPLIASNGISSDDLVRPERRNRSLSPIFETESSSLCLSSATSGIDLPPVLTTTTTTAMVATVQSTSTVRPILHVDPYITSSRKASAYTASVYSTNDQELLHSHFSPATPPEELQSHLGGLAISGIAAHAAIATSAPTSLHRVVGALPASTHHAQSSGYAFALANKPSFSKFRFPVASPVPAPAPTPASSDSSKAPSLLDTDDAGLIAPEDIDGAPSSTLTAATSTFESPQLALTELRSSTSSSAVSRSAAVPLDDSGLWRSGWSLESPSATRRSVPAAELELEEEIGVMPAAGTVQNAASTSRSPTPLIPPAAAAAVQAETEQPTASPSESRQLSVFANSKPSARQIRPVSFALPEENTTTSSQSANDHNDPKEEEAAEEPTSPAAPSQVFDLGTRTLSVQRKKSKVLPAIPDTASIWSGDDRVEVYCQRELVRHHHGRTERIVLERTLLYGEGEGASRNVVGMAV